MTSKLFVIIQSCYMPSYIVLVSMAPGLPDIRIICSLNAVTPHGLQILFHSRL